MSRGDEAKALTPRERALLHVTNEERHLPGPEIDADAVESRVLSKITAEAPPARRAPRWPVPVAAALLAAAGVAVTLGLHHQGEHQVSSSGAPTRALSGEGLVLGQSISAGETPLTVEHAGHARWTLSPGSQASLERRDSVVIVRLVSGALEADVEPRPVPETFVVEAGTVRAAVHGTHFVVKYEPASVSVDVTEGVVLVTREGTSESTPLRAPARRAFALGAGAPSSTARARRAPSSAAVTQAAAPQPAHVPASSRAALPGEPPISAVEAGVSEIVQAVQRCFAGSSGGSDVQVSVRSTVSFQVLPNGELRDVGFQPPLAPNVTACARAELGAVRFSESRRGITLSRVLELKR